MTDVFISYAREDRSYAKGIADALRGYGLTVFWDRTIPAGRTFENVIEEAIAEAKAVVVLWSRHSIRSDWVRAEASEGANRGILVPAILDGARPPLRYRVAQTADLTDWTPGSSSVSFAEFLDDVAATVRSPIPQSPTHEIKDPARPAKPSYWVLKASTATIQQALTDSVICAWLGSLALAVMFAHDYNFVTFGNTIYMAADFLTLLAFALGATASVTLGVLSLRQQFLAGILQGLVWPVIAGFAQVVILLLAMKLIRELAFPNEFYSLLVLVLCATIGPGFLTVGAVFANRALAR